MKLFGKKDAKDNNSEELPETTGDETADVSFDETPEPLSAPTRPELKAGSGRKNIMALLLLLAAGGIGGGYFFLTGQEETPYVADVDPLAETPVVDSSASPAEMAAVPVAVDPTVMPPEIQDAGTVSAAPPSAEDPLDSEPPVPEEISAQATAAVPPSADPLAQAPLSGSEVPPDASTVPSTPTDAATSAPVNVPQSELPVETASTPAITAPVVSGDVAPALATETAAVAPVVTPPTAADTGEDLPLPAAEENMSLPSDPAAVTVTPPAEGAVVATVPATADPAAAAQQPSAAELAIVNNAGTLDKMPAPEGAANDIIADIASQEAMIRPLPKQYLVMQKDHSAGEVDTRLTAARTALAQERPQASLQIFNELREEYPKDKRVLMGRAVALQKLGQTGEALSAYEDVLNRDPKNLEALTNMLGLLKKENPSLAVEKLVELREAYPFNADITAQLGIAYAGAGEYEEALKYLEIADALKPGSAFVLYNKGVLFDRMGRTQQAADIYRQIVRMAADGYLDQNLPLDVIKRRLAVIR